MQLHVQLPLQWIKLEVTKKVTHIEVNIHPHNILPYTIHFKDTIAVTKNMKYDFKQPTGEIESLEDYKIRLAKQMLLNVFFQDEKKQEFDMLR